MASVTWTVDRPRWPPVARAGQHCDGSKRLSWEAAAVKRFLGFPWLLLAVAVVLLAGGLAQVATGRWWAIAWLAPGLGFALKAIDRRRVADR
jgi:sulfite exporter TauE/SafE